MKNIVLLLGGSNIFFIIIFLFLHHFLLSFNSYAPLRSDDMERTTYRFNYGKHLEEKRHRGERNRKLLEMMDRIDQQAANLAAKSEMFKKVKVGSHILYKFIFLRISLFDRFVYNSYVMLCLPFISWVECVSTKKTLTTGMLFEETRNYVGLTLKSFVFQLWELMWFSCKRTFYTNGNVLWFCSGDVD